MQGILEFGQKIGNLLVGISCGLNKSLGSPCRTTILGAVQLISGGPASHPGDLGSREGNLFPDGDG